MSRNPNYKPDPKHVKFPLWSNKSFLALNENQQKFVFNYWQRPITGWKPWQCHQDAYPNSKKASSQVAASNFLKDPNISECIEIIKRQYRNKLGVTVERILKEESFLAFSDIANYFDKDGYLSTNPKKLPSRIRRAISSWETIHGKDGSVKYKVKLWSKGDSLQRLQNILGMSRNKVELSTPEGLQVQVNNNYDFELLDYEEKAQLKKLLDKCKVN